MSDDSQTQTTDATQYNGMRRWPRYPVSLSLRVRVPTTSGQEYMLAHGRDISQGGMAVYIPVDMEIGQTVLLQLLFPSLELPMTLFATVKNRIGFKYGVEFVDLPPGQQEIIVRHLQELLAATRSAGP